jgi:uncharacterized protein
MRILGPAAVAATALGAYSLYEPYRYRLVTHRLEMPSQVPLLKILHLSDLHLRARDSKLISFVHRLSSRSEIDIVLATGDLIEDDSGIEPLIDCFSRFEAPLGQFYVLGSHDYFQPLFDSYAKYFSGQRSKLNAPRAATPALQAGLAEHGWQPLINASTVVDTGRGRIRLTGIDDPYLKRQNVRVIRRGDDEVVAIGLVHSPEVVSEWFLAGFDLVLAGHTHAGQVRLPLVGAVVTNCSLPTGLAGGPHRVGTGWLHVSPGLGNGKFSPIRFNCRPEATILQLVH